MQLIKRNVVLGAFLTLSLWGCNQYESPINNTGEYPKEKFVTFKAVSHSSPAVSMSNINCYIFKGGIYYTSHKGITFTADGRLSLNVGLGTKLYFLTTMKEPSSYTSLKQGVSTEAEFLQLRSNEDAVHTATRAPEFYSGSFDVSNVVEGDNKIELKNGVARIDVDATSDALISVQSVEVTNASTTAQLFETTPLSSTTKKSYEQHYTVPAKGLVEDVFRIYESNTPISIKIHGTFDGVPFTCTSQTSLIERNKIYTIRVINAGASFTGIFNIKDWESGDIIETKPDATGKIRINPENSVLPVGSEIDEEATTLNIPSTGGEMQVAFVSSGPIDIVSIDGKNKDVVIDPTPAITTSGDAVVTKYTIAVQPQGDGRLPYSVDLRLKSAFREHDYDKVTLQVAESPKQIQTATIAGKTWMAFNTRSSTLDDQVYLTDGNTVEQMYSNSWISTIGNLFQFGRNYGYTPWKSGTNNQGGVSTGIPWVKEEHMPCPPGYRVPSRAELRSLLPDGQAIPSTFTSNGDQLKVEIMRSNPQDVSIGGIAGKGNYLRIISLTTSEKLYIPMAGQKPGKSTSANPEFGRGFTLWSSENAGAPNGYGWVTHFWPGVTASSGAIGTGNHTELEGFAYVRCIKK